MGFIFKLLVQVTIELTHKHNTFTNEIAVFPYFPLKISGFYLGLTKHWKTWFWHEKVVEIEKKITQQMNASFVDLRCLEKKSMRCVFKIAMS